MLDRRVASPVQLAQEIGASLDVVIDHLNALEKHGHVKLVRKSRRPTSGDNMYTTDEAPVVSGDAWDQVPLVVRRAAIENSLSQIGAFASAAASAGGFDRGDSVLARTELHLDEHAWGEVHDLVIKLLADVADIEKGAQERLRSGESQRAISSGLVTLFFHAAGFMDTGPGHRHHGVGRVTAGGGANRARCASRAFRLAADR